MTDKIDIDILQYKGSNFERAFLQNDKIILYGAGAATQEALEDIPHLSNIICICDKNAKDKEFMGYPLMKFQQALRQFDDFRVLISSFKYYNEIKADLMEFIQASAIFPYINWQTRIHYNYVSDAYHKWLRANEQNILKIYEWLDDDTSKKSFVYILKGLEQISADEWLEIAISTPSVTGANYFESGVFSLAENETYLDAGAFDGDTIEAFLSAVKGKYKKIIGYEPDDDIFEILKAKVDLLDTKNVQVWKKGLGSKKGRIGFETASNPLLNKLSDNSDTYIELDTIDDIAENEDLSLIKISVKGTDNIIRILEGGKNCLKKAAPKLAIIVSPTEESILEIPIKIQEINDKYKINFRLCAYQQGQGQRNTCCYYANI